MDISRSCKIKDLNWATLPHLVARLNEDGIDTGSVSVELRRYPDTLKFDSVEDACRDVRVNGAPKRFHIWVGQSLTISRDVNIHGEEFMYVRMLGIREPAQLDSLMEFLGLEPDEPSTLPPGRPRTAFIAHRFDSTGDAAADKLARFLELLQFKVVTGRAYSPGSVAAKVRSRIEEQEVLFIVLTPGTDDTWLTQESVIAEIKGRPLIVLKDHDADFKPGILADHEYVPFFVPDVETAFIQVLEGLRELGYLKFE